MSRSNAIKTVWMVIFYALLVILFASYLVPDLKKQTVKLKHKAVQPQNQTVGETRHPCFLNPTNLTFRFDKNYSKLLKSYHSLSECINNTYGLRHSQFEPSECAANTTIAIIIPVRNRTHHLHLLLGMLHPFLQKQTSRYRIYVIHQSGYDTFNKGILMNTGFLFARKDGEKLGHPYDCYIFHDVDLIPESEFNIYRCGSLNNITGRRNVHHMGHTLQLHRYDPMCCGITVGGVIAFTNEQYVKLNGYSNRYWGWGAEDDDILRRIRLNQYHIERNFGDHMRYTMIKHSKDPLNPINEGRFGILWNINRHTVAVDGLNSLKSKILMVNTFPLYVNVSVDVGSPS